MKFLSSMSLIMVLSLCAMAQTLTEASPQSVGLSGDRLNRINDFMERKLNNQQIAGAVTLVARKGKIAHFEAHGYADIASGAPIQKDSIFRIASMSKFVTAIAVMMLYEEGRFSLTDPVHQYIPEFKNMNILVPCQTNDCNTYSVTPATNPIQIIHLLTHRSGISYGFNHQRFLADLYAENGISDGLTITGGTIADMVKRLAEQPLLFNPGEKWEYSLGFDVLGYLVEVVSGMPFDQFLEERLFGPLGMTDTSFYVPAEKASRLVTAYTHDGNGNLTPTPDEEQTVLGYTYHPSAGTDSPGTYFSGGAGLHSTAMDYARLVQMVLNGGKYNGNQVLARKTVKMLTTNYAPNPDEDVISWFQPGYGYGMGIYVHRDSARSAHNASLNEAHAAGFWYTGFWFDHEEETFSIMFTNIFPWLEIVDGAIVLSDIQPKMLTLTNQAIVD